MNRIEKVSVTDMAASAIRNSILNGEYKVGDKLATEAKLCQQLNVSRTVVREALRILATEGYVRMVPGRGAFVAHITEIGNYWSLFSPTSFKDLMDVRAPMEELAARLAAQRCGAELTEREAGGLTVHSGALEGLLVAWFSDGTTACSLTAEGLAQADFDALVDGLAVGPDDAVVGITASGSAPYVLAALRRARARGSVTIGLCTNAHSLLESLCDVTIAPEVGPEVISGSTRLKSGTAQKMVLNMLSTCTMVKLGKVYGNLMVDLRASNKKLIDRSTRIIAQLAQLPYEQACEEFFKSYLGRAKDEEYRESYVVETLRRLGVDPASEDR